MADEGLEDITRTDGAGQPRRKGNPPDPTSATRERCLGRSAFDVDPPAAVTPPYREEA